MNNVFAPSTCPQPEAGEILITRSITFRNSTFGGLKAFIREYGHKTGKRLTNAAAVDLLVRAQLMFSLNRNALSQMLELSTSAALTALDGVADKAVDVIDSNRLVESEIPFDSPLRTPSRPSPFNIEVRKAKRVTANNGEHA